MAGLSVVIEKRPWNEERGRQRREGKRTKYQDGEGKSFRSSLWMRNKPIFIVFFSDLKMHI
jgi:hypothetical protein